MILSPGVYIQQWMLHFLNMNIIFNYQALQGKISSKEENMYNDHDWDDWSCFRDTNVTSMDLTNIVNMPPTELMKDMRDDVGDTGETRNEEMP